MLVLYRDHRLRREILQQRNLLSEAGVPPHSGAHRAAKSAPLGGGAQPPGGRRRAFCPPGRGDGLRRSSSPLAWGKYERVVRVSRQRRDEIKSYALVPR